MLWDFVHADIPVPDDPPERIHFEELYPEIVLRGLSVMIPKLKPYIEKLPPGTTVDGGYYTKSPDNKPLIGPISNIKNYFVCGGLSGYGIMASAAAGELLSLHILGGGKLPPYAQDFLPERFSNPQYKIAKKHAGALSSYIDYYK